MHVLDDPQFGDRLVTLMAALVLVLQLAMVGQRWLVTNIRIFAVQSLLLAAIAATIAWFNHAPHIYIAAVLTLLVKVILAPLLLENLVDRIGIQKEIDPVINVPLSILISGGLTLVGYTVAESFFHPETTPGFRTLGHNARIDTRWATPKLPKCAEMRRNWQCSRRMSSWPMAPGPWGRCCR